MDDLTLPQEMLDKIQQSSDLSEDEETALSVAIWRRLEATPGFNERIAEAEAQLEAGGGVLYRFDKLGRMYRIEKP